MHQDALQQLDNTTWTSNLVGMVSGAQASGSMLYSPFFNTSSFNALATTGIWAGYIPFVLSPPSWVPVGPDNTAGITDQDLYNAYNTAVYYGMYQNAGPGPVMLALNGTSYNVTAPAALPYTQTAYLQQGTAPGSPIAVTFMLAGNL